MNFDKFNLDACLLAVISLLACACAVPPPATAPAAITGLTPSPSPSPTITATQTPPTPSATPHPITGTLTIKVNIRSGPGTSYDPVGLLEAGETVEIVFRDRTSEWYQIRYPAAPNGYGWVAAQFVQVSAEVNVPFEPTPTPAGPSGRTLQRLNVRSGPGMVFDTIGILEADTQVSLTGKNATSSWFQIDYPSSPSGRGWVTAQYIQADAAGLPVLDDYGTPIANSEAGPTQIPVTLTPTVGPAFADGDSSASPGVRVQFSASGTRRFTYSGQVSAPQGDPEDWVEFTPFVLNGAEAHLVFSLTCSGNASLVVELLQGGSLFTGWGSLACGDLAQSLTLPAGVSYQMRLQPSPGAGLRLVNYVLTVESMP